MKARDNDNMRPVADQAAELRGWFVMLTGRDDDLTEARFGRWLSQHFGAADLADLEEVERLCALERIKVEVHDMLQGR